MRNLGAGRKYSLGHLERSIYDLSDKASMRNGRLELESWRAMVGKGCSSAYLMIGTRRIGEEIARVRPGGGKSRNMITTCSEI